MSTVSYETDEGIFFFDQKDVIDALKELDSPDAIALMEFLKSQSGEKKGSSGRGFLLCGPETFRPRKRICPVQDLRKRISVPETQIFYPWCRGESPQDQD
jgi:hypothetical protein